MRHRTAFQSHLTPIPTLDELLSHPDHAKDLPLQVAADLLAQVASLQPLLLSRLFTGMSAPSAGGHPEEDRLLLVGEAAALLGMTEDYLYRHAHQLPFTVRPAPRQVRFSKSGIQRYISQRQGR
jgi:predicted DNA-binding transcriptional regulator AlpA